MTKMISIYKSEHYELIGKNFKKGKEHEWSQILAPDEFLKRRRKTKKEGHIAPRCGGGEGFL